MKISVKKQITQQEDVELSLPAFFEKYGVYKSINEDGTLICVGRSMIHITKKDDPWYDREVGEAIAGTPCSRLDYENRLTETMESIHGTIGREAVTI